MNHYYANPYEVDVIGTGREYLMLRHGLDDAVDFTELSSEIGLHPSLHLRKPSQQLDDLYLKLPTEDMLRGDEGSTLGRRFEIGELETLCPALVVARNSLRIVGRAAGTKILERATDYDLLHASLSPALQTPGGR